MKAKKMTMGMIVGKYIMLPMIKLINRRWPRRRVKNAPIWCSVDLRDGNQSLPVPMTVYWKKKLFKFLLWLGFKEIEVGFPAASSTDEKFVRTLIREKLIPKDVTIQVLVQSREEQIKKTVRSLIGAKRVIIHLYNSTSPDQREIVFKATKQETINLAVQGMKWIKEYSRELIGTDVIIQYSPESFSATEPKFAVKICEAVMEVIKPTPEHKMIINLPETVQIMPSDHYADQIEYFCRHIKNRRSLIICVHPHNDHGNAVASAELARKAGAERVEGTLFGNGERTGNLDIITMALNLFSQGINPGLNLHDIMSIRKLYERCTGMKVPSRHPYAGDLVFTAFSGSHQDAIRKGLKAMEKSRSKRWRVPYLVIDPADIGRKCKDKKGKGIIRINGQSGKGGIAYVLEDSYNISLPKDVSIEFGSIAGKIIDASGREATPSDLRKMFFKEYIDRESPYKFMDYRSSDLDKNRCSCSAKIKFANKLLNLIGKGNGPIDAFICSLKKVGIDVHVCEEAQHSIGSGEKAPAISYIKLEFPDGIIRWGAGIDKNTHKSAIKAVISALDRK